MAEKSILEQALLHVETLEEALKQNSKGILGSVLKQELNGLLKESMEKEEDEKEKESETPVDEQGDEDEMTEPSPEQDENDMEDEASSDEESLDKNIDSEDSEMSDDDMSDDMDGDDMTSDDSVMDMTGASDDEVLKVFKAMKPEDGIVVKKDGNNLDIEIDGNEYVIKLDELDEADSMDEEMDETSLDEEEDTTDEEETVYEIELDEDDDSEKEETKEAKVEPSPKSSKSVKKVEATEAARTKWNPHGDKGGSNRAGLKSKKLFKAGSGSINEEVTKLRKQNDEYKKALVLFKEKLNEVAVFNASLAYSTRLFTEHSTTKQEKLNILKRFDSVSTMNESKNLYNTIKAELDTKKPVTESVVDKISSTVKTSSSKEVLSEAKAYENPQFKRMKDLMNKIK
jgi:hypothetical protein